MNYQIQSLDNEKIKKVCLLKEARKRKASGLFLVEGPKEISLAQEAGFVLTEVYYLPEKDNNYRKEEKAFSVSPAVMEKISYREKPQGVLAVFKEKTEKLEDYKLEKQELILVLDTVEKPGNIGAIARSAKASGVKLIILSDYQGDIYNPNAIRASRGHIFSTKIISVKHPELLAWIKKTKQKVFLAQGGEKENYWKTNLKDGGLVVLGREDLGLSSYWQKEKTKKISIPMQNKVDSLNVSVSAALIAYEHYRQKSL